ADAARGLERLALGSADRLIAVSRELESWLVGLGVPRHRISVHANGVDVARFAAPSGAVDEIRTRFGFGDTPVVGFLGTLKPWHGTKTLVRAAAMIHRQGLTSCLLDRKSTRLNSSHVSISYAVFCLKKKINLKFLCI